MASLGAARAAYGQISPGPLAKAHEQLDGTLRCVNCHGVGGKDQMNAQCLQCHKEVAWLIAQRRGFHARQPDQRCASCHPDHAGRDFALIAWPGGDPLRFDHALAGWPLEGHHQTLKCADCHKPAFRVGEAAQLSPRKGATPGWVGLERKCTACHEDVHRGALSPNCVSCHDQTHWKPAPGFDHAKTDYPLTGKHQEVGCEACHKPRPGAAPVFKPVAHADCVACHTDPHHGRFTGACSACHVTRGFTIIDRGHFDHDRTRFPLLGKHASVACSACHDLPGQKGRNPPFATCTGCHADAHAGTATLAGAVVDCSACHNEAGFTVATYTVVQHQHAKYPLEGRHKQVACLDCHRKKPPGVPTTQLGTAGVLMRPAFGACLDCHRDDHGGQLAGRSDKGACSGCHTVAGWRPSTFTVAAHAKARFQLEGRHAEIACAACHGPNRTGLPPLPGTVTLGRAGVRFRLDELDCTSCHVDPHQGRFATGGAHAVAGGCPACHTSRSYRPSTVDVAAHARYTFPLDGAHRAVPCVSCHADLQYTAPTSSLVQVRWTGAPLLFAVRNATCQGCHESPHGDQFATRSDKGRCESCHDTDAFRPASRFDHDRDTKFPLRGGHANVPCSRCHPMVSGPNSKRWTRYRPVSSRCEACHGDGGRPQ
jgi:Cytochrome c7 and related cytochrome c